MDQADVPVYETSSPWFVRRSLTTRPQRRPCAVRELAFAELHEYPFRSQTAKIYFARSPMRRKVSGRIRKMWLFVEA